MMRSILLLTLLVACTGQRQLPPAPARTNADIARRFVDELFNKRNYAIVDTLVAEGYLSHNGLTEERLGREGLKAAVRAQHEAFPDLRTEILGVVADGDLVVVRARDVATHAKAYLGYAPTGKQWSLTWMDMYRVENGRLAESWMEANLGELRRQLEGKD